MQFCKAFFLLLIILLSNSCSSILFDSADKINDLADRVGWKKYFNISESLTLAGFYKPFSVNTNILHVYIEGDGARWIHSSLPPDDPTPNLPVSLKMAIADPHPNVLYLARPCQLTRGLARKGCSYKLWTYARFSPTVIETTNSAISSFVERLGKVKIVLYGYSGGGAVAALVAAKRLDVIGLVTVSGTLDHEAWTTHHNVSPLEGSLNPVNFKSKLSSIPQIHYTGEDDKVVPNLVVKSYIRKLNINNKAKVISFKNYNHYCCWIKNWPKILKINKFHD